MNNNTKISWCDATWNPVVGCSPVSEGCENCYAKAMAQRFNGGDFNVKFHPERLEEPLKLKKPSKIFICSVSDLFHPEVNFHQVDAVLDIVFTCRKHTFQILTKRPERALEYYQKIENKIKKIGTQDYPITNFISSPNIHLGVTCETQKRADERIPFLYQMPVTQKFISFEPLLEKVDIIKSIPFEFYCNRDDWPKYNITGGISYIIIGCESGPKRRLTKLEWVYSLVEQCKEAGVKIHIKQLEINGKVTSDIEKFPQDLQIREI